MNEPMENGLRLLRTVTGQEREQHLMNMVQDAEARCKSLRDRVYDLERQLQRARHETEMLQIKLITEQGISEMRQTYIDFYRRAISQGMFSPIPDRSRPVA